jgi:HrpA-like RNA helicase
MLLRAPCPDSSQGRSKLFISQPRRIAAKALVERLRQVEPDLRDQIALRMGHGVRGMSVTAPSSLDESALSLTSFYHFF